MRKICIFTRSLPVQATSHLSWVLGNYGTCSFPILSSLWKSKEKEIKDGRAPSTQTVDVHADSQTHSFLGCFCFCSICVLQMRKTLCCLSLLLQEPPTGKWQLTCRPSSTAWSWSGELLLPQLDGDADRAGDALQGQLVAGSQEWTRWEKGESCRGPAEASLTQKL